MRVNRAQAEKRPTHHSFIAGMGYVEHAGPADVRPLVPGKQSCEPPANSREGSAHLLQPPNGGDPVTLIWNAAQRTWSPALLGKGNRMAWTPAYLKGHRWKYLRAADGVRERIKSMRGEA